jgi:hypothetical protein
MILSSLCRRIYSLVVTGIDETVHPPQASGAKAAKKTFASGRRVAKEYWHVIASDDSRT